jgi:hypothetical protein
MMRRAESGRQKLGPGKSRVSLSGRAEPKKDEHESGAPCTRATNGKWKAVRTDLVASWSERKENGSETKTLLQGEKPVLDAQNEDHRKHSVLSQLTRSKTKTAAAEKWHMEITLREQKSDRQNQRPRKRTREAYSDLENQRKEKQVAYKREAQIEFFIEIYIRLQPIYGCHRPPSIWLLK